MMPTAMLSPLIPGAIEFLVFLLLVPFGVRSPWPRSLVTRMLGTAVLVHTGFALLMFGVLPGLKFWHATATFGLLFMGLWFVYGVVTKSVSALVVMRLWQDRKDHAPEVLTGQIAQQEFMTRVDLLAEASLISPTPGGGWAITEVGHGTADRIRTLRQYAAIRTGGLYGLPGRRED